MASDRVVIVNGARTPFARARSVYQKMPPSMLGGIALRETIARSDLDPKLPTEATDPALCGVLSASPVGAMATGAGGAAGSDSTPVYLFAGGALLLAAAGTGAFAVRRAHAKV